MTSFWGETSHNVFLQLAIFGAHNLDLLCMYADISQHIRKDIECIIDIIKRHSYTTLGMACNDIPGSYTPQKLRIIMGEVDGGTLLSRARVPTTGTHTQSRDIRWVVYRFVTL